MVYECMYSIICTIKCWFLDDDEEVSDINTPSLFTMTTDNKSVSVSDTQSNITSTNVKVDFDVDFKDESSNVKRLTL